MIDFLKYRYWTALFSVVLVAAFVGVAVYKYQTRGHAFSWSVDFTGGWQGLFKFAKPVSLQAVKDVLDKDWAGVAVRDFSTDEVMVKVKDVKEAAAVIGDQMQQKLSTAFSDNKVSILQTEYVGAAVGEALKTKSWYAIVFALLAMLLYIAIRFWSFSFAFGAVIALFHDALVMLAVFLFLDREISVNVIGAILAVLGYSINDTIVIFSQIRDNLHLKNKSLYEIVNLSLNQMLKRTLLTSISTGLVVGAMFIFGGEALRDFSLALLVGIIFGTYSSIYIASPIMMLFYRSKAA